MKKAVLKEISGMAFSLENCHPILMENLELLREFGNSDPVATPD